MDGQRFNVGYINKNKQKNIGRSDFTGTDQGTAFFNMECQICGHFYFASEPDLFEGRCPRCQIK